MEGEGGRKLQWRTDSYIVGLGAVNIDNVSMQSNV